MLSCGCDALYLMHSLLVIQLSVIFMHQFEAAAYQFPGVEC
jgi:hypothetical protein